MAKPDTGIPIESNGMDEAEVDGCVNGFAGGEKSEAFENCSSPVDGLNGSVVSYPSKAAPETDAVSEVKDQVCFHNDKMGNSSGVSIIGENKENGAVASADSATMSNHIDAENKPLQKTKKQKARKSAVSAHPPQENSASSRLSSAANFSAALAKRSIKVTELESVLGLKNQSLDKMEAKELDKLMFKKCQGRVQDKQGSKSEEHPQEKAEGLTSEQQEKNASEKKAGVDFGTATNISEVVVNSEDVKLGTETDCESRVHNLLDKRLLSADTSSVASESSEVEASGEPKKKKRRFRKSGSYRLPGEKKYQKKLLTVLKKADAMSYGVSLEQKVHIKSEKKDVEITTAKGESCEFSGGPPFLMKKDCPTTASHTSDDKAAVSQVSDQVNQEVAQVKPCDDSKPLVESASEKSSTGAASLSAGKLFADM